MTLASRLRALDRRVLGEPRKQRVRGAAQRPPRWLWRGMSSAEAAACTFGGMALVVVGFGYLVLRTSETSDAVSNFGTGIALVGLFFLVVLLGLGALIALAVHFVVHRRGLAPLTWLLASPSAALAAWFYATQAR